MTEPPAKRPRRVDSSTMWEMNDRRTRSSEPEMGDKSPRREPHTKPDGPRNRSRSRDRRDRRRERSRSRDRDRRDKDGRRERKQERGASRDRYYDRRDYPPKGDRYRERSRSPARNGAKDRSRTPPSRGPTTDRRGDRRGLRSQINGTTEPQRPSRTKDEMDVDVDTGDDDLESLMRKCMGFTRFRSTKNTKIPGNDIYGVRKEKKTQYRQYMNRPGGFNRPLSP